MNLQTLQSQLKTLERRRQALESRIRTRAAQQFNALPKRVGLRTVDQLIVALAPYASPAVRGRLQVDGAAIRAVGRRDVVVAARRPGGGKRGPKPKYGPELRAAVKAALVKGDQSNVAIARRFRVSIFSLKDWKREWGLTKKPQKKARKGPAKKK